MTKFFQKFGLVFFLILIIAVIVIPLVINEAYKHDVIYVTMWNAADVLSYYGTILGAVATTSAMVITIIFTYMQIRRDSYLKNENEKWTKIENVFANALNSISPMLPILETMDTGFTNPSAAITTIQKYQISCKVATDQLNMYLNIIDYPKVTKLIEAINNFSECVSPICTDIIEMYSKLQVLLYRDTAKKTIDTELQYPGSFPIETLVSCLRTIDDTNGINFKNIEYTIGQLNKQMIEQYNDPYRSLLQLKGATFEQINMEIQENADSILHIWKKK